ncbi:hypothetical protein BSZ19_18670 [Bradyrhizobium japonicum]|uniref:Uncharacterized protein n=1 Tax=Bradyrhizobium japonicum TaxID=375 RepID=A0A1Y2JP12_BRAJP|nr:hypothetical protein [Bradyrhizobium japonicum]OSJ32575.1 hypothetical protein BSZ19_18670 [Bradyrhizobium japonicum]
MKIDRESVAYTQQLSPNAMAIAAGGHIANPASCIYPVEGSDFAAGQPSDLGDDSSFTGTSCRDNGCLARTVEDFDSLREQFVNRSDPS